ncbi:MAG: hypothetical protein LC744_07540 [Chloroflexi bacterium]|nr:hypothetical protein [Chloroflexota bacterium]
MSLPDATHAPDPPQRGVPISVRLGEVVPPEDPEDWTRPLTWVVALGMLAGPLAAAAWFVVGAPAHADGALPGTFLVAAILAGGAAATGATQQGVVRAATATLGAGLFAALVVVVLGVVASGERQTGAASPMLAHALAAALGGVAGAAVASVVAGFLARTRSTLVRLAPAVLAGATAAVAGVAVLTG